MAKKGNSRANRITNRRAGHDYTLDDSLVVGIQLTGAETKSLRRGHGVLRGAYVTVRNDELWLINAQIMQSPGVQIPEPDQTRTRKLLAKRSQIDKLIAEKQTGKTIVPLELITHGRYIKLRVAVGKGKKHWDKRETLKRRQQERDIKRVA
jgi:SsrA-binding protein